MIDFYYAPMCHLSGLAYRRMLRHYHPDIKFITQMFSTDAINFNPLYSSQLLKSFDNHDKTTTQIQVVTTSSESLLKALPLLKQLKIAGININFACPAPCAQKAGYGEYFPKKDIKTCLEALRNEYDGLISVKVRLPEIAADDVEFFAQFDKIVDVVVVHARRKRLHNCKAQREQTDFLAVQKVQELGFSFKIIINGGIKSVADGEKLVNEHGVAGYMIGLELARNPRLIVIEKYFSQFEPLYYYVKNLLEVKGKGLLGVDTKTENIRHVQMLGSKIVTKEDYADMNGFLVKLEQIKSSEFE